MGSFGGRRDGHRSVALRLLVGTAALGVFDSHFSTQKLVLGGTQHLGGGRRRRNLRTWLSCLLALHRYLGDPQGLSRAGCAWLASLLLLAGIPAVWSAEATGRRHLEQTFDRTGTLARRWINTSCSPEVQPPELYRLVETSCQQCQPQTPRVPGDCEHMEPEWECVGSGWDEPCGFVCSLFTFHSP